MQLRSVSASERSLDRRKTVEKKALGKKMSALEDLRAKRERKQGAFTGSPNVNLLRTGIIQVWIGGSVRNTISENSCVWHAGSRDVCV